MASSLQFFLSKLRKKKVLKFKGVLCEKETCTHWVMLDMNSLYGSGFHVLLELTNVTPDRALAGCVLLLR